ncbi:integrase [Oceanobacillus picturae]|uniref:Integrase n=1 Tax=Oceanobacillus picturae TaxID=171693 RepID=A0A0U9H8X3_9BACI|nr:tyrosine-type recombinase/integrase [Oceanobacillus picturae]GAQ19123.1 integrase [Oceanobacillus picturae]
MIKILSFKDKPVSSISNFNKLEIAGLDQELTPDPLRHTHTSLLAEAKVGLEEMMDRLDHTEDRTTRNTYLYLTKELKKEASQKFDQLMRSLQ